MGKIISIAFKNILKHPGKNILTGIMVLIASSIFLFTDTLYNNCIREWRAYYSNTSLGTYNINVAEGLERDNTMAPFKYPSKYIPDELVNYLDNNKLNYTKRFRLAGIKYNYETQEFDGGPMPLNVIATNVTKELSNYPNLKITDGKYDPSVENGVVLWRKVAESSKLKVGGEISFFMNDVDGNPVPITLVITGLVYNINGDNMDKYMESNEAMNPVAFVNYDYIAGLLGVENGGSNEIAIWDRNFSHYKNIKKLAAEKGVYVYTAEMGYGIVDGLSSFLKFLGAFLGTFILVILIISTFNINIMGFLERQKEIGTMYAIGAKPLWIIKLLLAEMLMFGVAAYVISIVFYMSLAVIFPGGISLGDVNVAFAGSNMHFNLEPSSAVTTFAIIIVSILLSTLYPLYLTMKINPVEVFREGEM